MKALFLNPPFMAKYSKNSRSPAVSKGGCVYYPRWLCYALGWIEKQGHEGMLIDSPAQSNSVAEVITKIAQFQPELIVVDTSTPSIHNDIKVVEAIKAEHPKTFIVMVGPHVTAMPESVLKMSTALDAVAFNEYEHTSVDLLHALQGKMKMKDVKGIMYRDGEELIKNEDRPEMTVADIEALPFVTEVYKKHLRVEDYFYPSVLYPEVTIVTARGCPFRCTYCMLPQTFTGRNFRARSVKNTVDEFEWIANNLPQVKDIMLEDDTFTVDKKRVKEVCEEIVRRGIKVTWTVNARCDVDLETQQAMKKAGCRLMCVGVESASQDILNNVKKGIRVEQIRQFFKDSKKSGLLVHACFMLGNPGETIETAHKTVEFAKEMNADTAQFYPIMLYPGTEMYDWAKEKGFLVSEDFKDWLTEDGLHNSTMSTDTVDSERLVELCDEARKEYYLRWDYIKFKAKQMIVMPNEIPRTIKSALTFAKYLVQGSKVRNKKTPQFATESQKPASLKVIQ